LIFHNAAIEIAIVSHRIFPDNSEMLADFVFLPPFFSNGEVGEDDLVFFLLNLPLTRHSEYEKRKRNNHFIPKDLSDIFRLPSFIDIKYYM